MTLADAIAAPRLARAHSGLRNLALVFGGSLLVALSAQIAIPLPWTPVPITGQTLGVLLVGAALGAHRGFLALAMYLAEGAAGLPFFAAGTGGPMVFVGPTAGYLISFPIAAFVVGWLAERGWDRKTWSTALAMALGTGVIFASGVLWLSNIVGWSAVWAIGLLPFLPGAVVKIAVASAAMPLAWKVVGSRSSDDSRDTRSPEPDA